MDKLEQWETFDWNCWAKLLYAIQEIIGRRIEHIMLYINDTLITYLTNWIALAFWNPHRFLNILSWLTTVELYLILNLERHLRALEIKRQEVVQKNKALRSTFLAQEVIDADEHIHKVAKITSHCRSESNYQNNSCDQEQRIADGITFANTQCGTTRDPWTRNNHCNMGEPSREVLYPPTHQQ